MILILSGTYCCSFAVVCIFGIPTLVVEQLERSKLNSTQCTTYCKIMHFSMICILNTVPTISKYVNWDLCGLHARETEPKLVPLWCTKSATHYWVFFLSVSSSPCYVTEILTPYLKTCPITTQPTHFFNKTVPTAHTAKTSLCCMQLISQELWPTCSPDVSWCSFYLYGTLKDIMYDNNPHTEDNI